jgi:general secretion pathway protein E
VVSSKSDILKCITDIYGFQSAIKGAGRELARGPDIGNLEQFFKLKNVDELDTNDRHVVNAVEYIFHYAFDQRASDVHFEPRREKCLIRMRIDGVLHEVYTLPRAVYLAVANRVKMLSRMDISEKRRPQDGRIKTERDGVEVELRVSTLPVAFGEKIVIRIFDPQVLLQDLVEVGFQREDETLWLEFIAQREGLILVTGPTGSGKTTTLYSTLRRLSSPRVNITTIEDPIELVVEEFNQVLVQEKIGVDFAAGLRTVLRQDPDVIMVGEIRDRETAQMAIQAALTGHLVFSTLHTNDAPSTVTRLLDLGVEPYKIASVLVGVMAQRLVRRVCDQCRRQTVLTPEQIAALQIPVPAGGPPLALKVCYGEGCVRCRGTGLYGRTGIFEILKMTPTLRRMIKEGASSEELHVAAVADGMRSLRTAALRQLAEGATSFDEVAYVLGEGDV